MSRGKLLDIVGLIACIILALHLGHTYGHLVLPHPTPPVPYKIGQQLTDTKALSLSSSNKTLVLAASSTCPYCERGMPFYQRLAMEAKRAHVRFIAVTSEDTSHYREHLLTKGVELESVEPLKDNLEHIRSTPTLILAGRDGKVLNCWVGLLTDVQQTQVLRSLYK